MDQICEALKNGNERLSGIVWGVPALVLFMGVGLLLTVGLKGLQFRRFGWIMKNTAGKMFRRQKARNGEVTPFQALTTSLAATVGTGNIAGITSAVTLGGPGAIFWMWASALLGMATKYAEVLLSVKFRERSARGDWVGGPMYYIRNGLGGGWKWLGAVFCVFGGLASFGIGNAVQIGNITDAVNTALQAFVPSAAEHQTAIHIALALILMSVVGIVLLGGVKRIGLVTEKLVPFMSVVYIAACLAVVAVHADRVPHALALIVRGAFAPEAVTGGAAGMSVKLCIEWGIKRGVFSNEAGLGSAPIAHAASSESDPVKQGLYGIFEVFVDTIAICTLSGLTLLLTADETALRYGVEGGTAWNARALGAVFGDKAGALIIAVGLSLFALSTVLSWGLYGSRCWEFLLGGRAIKPYQFVFTLVVMVSATVDLSLIWSIADTLNGLMAVPNLIALTALSPVVFRTTREHLSSRRRSE